MQPQIEQTKPTNQGRMEALISRSEMIAIAREYRLFLSYSTIYRWTNEPGFPLAVGKDGRNLLYAKSEVIAFLRRRLRKLLEEY